VLIAFGGLPGVGKSEVARELARALGATYVRIDSIEQAIRESGVTVVSIDDAGYRVAWSVAEDNLTMGHVVVADSVNPWPLTRDAWRDVARRVNVPVLEIEIVCSDTQEHHRRVEERRAATSRGPTWAQVLVHDYRPWHRPHHIVDTAARSVSDTVTMLRTLVRQASER
jgi:predicted kinase